MPPARHPPASPPASTAPAWRSSLNRRRGAARRAAERFLAASGPPRPASARSDAPPGSGSPHPAGLAATAGSRSVSGGRPRSHVHALLPQPLQGRGALVTVPAGCGSRDQARTSRPPPWRRAPAPPPPAPPELPASRPPCTHSLPSRRSVQPGADRGAAGLARRRRPPRGETHLSRRGGAARCGARNPVVRRRLAGAGRGSLRSRDAGGGVCRRGGRGAGGGGGGGVPGKPGGEGASPGTSSSGGVAPWPRSASALPANDALRG